MRRRRQPPEALARPSDSPFVEDWVDPTEPVPSIPENTAHERRQPQPGEPLEAVPWRLLAEERAEAVWRAWGRSQPPASESPELVEGVDFVRTRDELPPEARQPREPEPVDPERLVVHPFQGGARLRWRDVHAFLTKIL